MPELRSKMPLRASEAMMAPVVASAIFSLMIGGAVTACTRRNTDPDQAARDNRLRMR